MKNLLIAVACLAGAGLLYVFVIKPLLEPKAKPADPIGAAINDGVGLVRDVVSGGAKAVKAAGSTAVSLVQWGVDAFTGGGTKTGFGASLGVLPPGGGGYAKPVALTAEQQTFANTHTNDRYLAAAGHRGGFA